MMALYNKALQSDKIVRCALNFAAERGRYNARESIQIKRQLDGMSRPK